MDCHCRLETIMGNFQSRLSDEEYQWFDENTFFARVEIMKIYNLFSDLTKTSMVMPRDQFLGLPVMKHNPFKFRIFSIFCEDGESMNVREFVHFLSIFSDGASLEVKAYFAFLIYDVNEDDFLDKDDLAFIIENIVANDLGRKEIKVILNSILAEADYDGDGKLSLAEFQHVVQRTPNFRQSWILM